MAIVTTGENYSRRASPGALVNAGSPNVAVSKLPDRRVLWLRACRCHLREPLFHIDSAVCSFCRRIKHGFYLSHHIALTNDGHVISRAVSHTQKSRLVPCKVWVGRPIGSLPPSLWPRVIPEISCSMILPQPTDSVPNAPLGGPDGWHLVSVGMPAKHLVAASSAWKPFWQDLA